MSEQTPGGEPPIDPATPPTDPAPRTPDTETVRVPWEAATPPPSTPPAEPWGAPTTEPPPAGAGAGSVSWATPAPQRSADVPGAPGLVFADTISRFIAYVIDGFVLLMVVGIVAGVVAAIVGGGRGSISDQTTSNVVSNVVFVVASLAYSVFFWTGGRRATLGQMLFKIQVGNAFDGRPLTGTQAVKRWLGLGWFFSLLAVVPVLGPLSSLAGLAWFIVLLVTTVRSPTKQGFHDRFANSALVRPRDSSSRGPASACLVIFLVLIALFVISIVALIFLGSQVSGILSDVGRSIQAAPHRLDG